MNLPEPTPSFRRRALLAAAAAAVLPARAQSAPAPQRWPAGRPTPALQLANADGGSFRLADAKGQIVLLNFWASWCEPCRAELPSLELLAERYAKQGLQVLAVNYRETDQALARFIAQYPLTLPVLRDRDGAAARAWGVRIFPTTIAIGRDGAARFTVTGEVDWGGAEPRRWIEPLL